MKEIKKTLEDNYLAFITIAAVSVVVIALGVWGVTSMVKKVKRNSVG